MLGAEEAVAFLAPKPVSFIFGVGKVSAARLQRDGFGRIADLQRTSEIDLMRRYGEEGRRLARLARGIDTRKSAPTATQKAYPPKPRSNVISRTFALWNAFSGAWPKTYRHG